jgi:ribosome maturation factor RimP
MGAAERVSELVVPLLEEIGLGLYDVEWTGGSVRVLVQRDGGVDVDSLTEATRRISRSLDEADPIPGTYTLEVSSPGLERPLRTEEHYRGAVGELVTIKLRAGVESDRRIDGVLTGVAEGVVTVAPAEGSTVTVSIADVDRARTRFEWQAAPKPGGSRGKGGKGGKGGARAGATDRAEDETQDETQSEAQR